MQSLPRWIERFIERIAPKELSEGILGDLEEMYYEDQQIFRSRKAKRRLVWNAVRFCRPGILLRNRLKTQLNTDMFRNHLKIGLRSIRRQKLYSFINALGLGIAISFCVMIFLYIQDERSFDQWHSQKDQVYRIHGMMYNDQEDSEAETDYIAWLQAALGPTLMDEFEGVESMTRISSGMTGIFKNEDKVFSETMSYVDPGFFKMFDFEVKHGDPSQFLMNKTDIVLTASTSAKFFGAINPVGNMIDVELFGELKTFEIVGVIEDVPSNSSINYESAIIHTETQPYYEGNMKNWMSWNSPTFVKIGKNFTSENLLEALDEINKNHVMPTKEEASGELDDRPIYGITALEDIHLEKSINWFRVSDPKYSFILSGISLLILMIACINYITLAVTSSSAKRLEVGIRKSVGGYRKQLVGQFLTESVLLSIIAMVLSVILILLFLPYFNQFTGKNIELLEVLPLTIPVIILFSVGIGLVAGLYPAFYLSGLNPIAMLKARRSSRINSAWSRPLVIFQFGISAFLIICSVVMYQQMNYITTKDLGYSGDQVLVLPTHTGWTDKGEKLVDRFKQQAASDPRILSVTGASTSFSRGWNQNTFEAEGEAHTAYVYRVDPNYIETLQMNIVEGRSFDPSNPADKQGTIIVNQALVKDMGWDNPLEQRLTWRDSIGHRVIGVVEDYHFLSLENKVEPVLLGIGNDVGMITYLLVKLDGENLKAGVESAEGIWTDVAGGKPFEYDFLDDDISNQYATYDKWSSIMGLTTLFAILIACLGLFGLSGLNAINKTKEIGIRKVMGAELSQIMFMMNKPFIIVAVLSFTLAAPFSWYVMKQWLADFEFAIEMGPNVFILSFLAAVIFAMLTVSYHAFRSSTINPAETLKSE